jgi:hypothetical protein
MPTLSPEVGSHLLKATRSQDLDEAFEKVLPEYLRARRFQQVRPDFGREGGHDGRAISFRGKTYV